MAALCELKIHEDVKSLWLLIEGGVTHKIFCILLINVSYFNIKFVERHFHVLFFDDFKQISFGPHP